MNDISLAHIGRNMERFMALRGMDARSLAARLGVDESAVSLWRSGKRLPRLTVSVR